jgi:hypothetical protein
VWVGWGGGCMCVKSLSNVEKPRTLGFLPYQTNALNLNAACLIFNDYLRQNHRQDNNKSQSMNIMVSWTKV